MASSYTQIQIGTSRRKTQDTKRYMYLKFTSRNMKEESNPEVQKYCDNM